MELEKLIVPLLLDNSDYLKKLEESRKGTDGLVGSLKSIGTGVIVGGIAIAGAGIAALGGFLASSVEAASEAADIQADLAATLESTGGAAGMTVESVNDLATALSGVTKFEDDTIVKGESMLLTFTNIGKDVFPAATEAMLNMSQKMGTDLQSSAIQLGKALNDPVNGITALTRVGVTFSDEQKKMIEEMVKAGDVAGAQKIILGELEKEFGGVAKAAGQTLSGKLEILKNKFGNIKETIGGALLPIGQKLLDKFILPMLPTVEKLGTIFGDFVTMISNGASPLSSFGLLIERVASLFGMNAVQAYELRLRVQEIIEKIIDIKNRILEFIQPIITWIQNTISIKDVLIALGIAVAAVVLPALWGLITAVGTILLPIVALIAIIALLRTAWETNFLGIRDIITNFWNNSLKPAFEAIAQWLKVNIPIAIQKASDFWNNTLHPALQKIADFWNNTLKPAFEAIKLWLETNIPLAINTIKTKWDELKTKFDEIKTKITETVTKLKDLVDSGIAVVQLAIQTLKDKWDELKTKFIDMKNNVLGPLVTAFNGVKNAIQWVIDKVLALISKLALIKIPKVLEKHSPSEFEESLYAVNDAMNEINEKTLPKFQANLGVDQSVFATTQSRFVQFVYSPTFSLADQFEAENQLRPIIEAVVRR